MATMGLGRAKTFHEFAIFHAEPGTTGFEAGLRIFHDFRGHSLLQARHIDGIGSHGLRWALLGLIYARIACISGVIPRMLITRVRL